MTLRDFGTAVPPEELCYLALAIGCAVLAGTIAVGVRYPPSALNTLPGWVHMVS